MLDGLEAVELKLSEVLEDNNKFRFDSEFFQKEYLEIEEIIKSHNSMKTKNLISDLTDYHANGSYKVLKNYVELLDNDNYALMVRTTDLERSDFYTDVKYITKKAYDFLEKTKVYGGEIIINKIGTNAGNIYLMPFLERKVSLGMNQFMLKVSNINTNYLYTFFISKLGRKMLKRRVNGAAPFSIDKDSILNINIPILSKKFQNKIHSYIMNHFKLIEDSKIIYKEAEELLLKELDLLDFEPLNIEYDSNNSPRKKGITIKSFSESFGNSGRLDSEYYQPKFDYLIDKIKGKNHDKLENIVNLHKSVEPGSEAYQDNGIPFVRVSNLTKLGLSDTNIHLSKDLYDDETLEKLQPKENTILLSKDGTVGIAYNIKHDTNIITSGAILHLIIKDDNVLPEYLALVLNSLVVQMQSERDAGGSIIKHWKPSEIGQVLIPIIDYSIQVEIEEKIKESFRLKEESGELLELAKKAVEIATEENEEFAMEFINAQV